MERNGKIIEDLKIRLVSRDYRREASGRPKIERLRP